MPVRPLVAAVEPDRLIEDKDRLDVPGWNLVAVWTPGHSPGHLCFHEPDRDWVFSGDHVLPRITPNISVHPQSGPDPLGEYLASLDKVAALPADLVLPAHEHRFVGLVGRVDQLKRHHEQRFAEVLAALGDGVDTGWDVAARMTWSRSWDRIDGFMRRAALGEALAHLHALRALGRVTSSDTVPVRWRLTPPTPG